VLFKRLFFRAACTLSFAFPINSTCIKQIFPPQEDVETNFSQGDGFGSQFQNIIAASIYAELNNKTFLYTPFTAMEHNYENNPNFIAQKEWLINFIGNFDINPYPNIPIKNYKEFFDQNIQVCAQSNTLQKIKAVFRANKRKENYFDSNYFNIAIHIRRSNPHDTRIDGTDVPNEVFRGIIKALRIKYQTQNVLFHIYSQGNATNFIMFEEPDIKLHLNETVEDTFPAMVLADALVISASSFSYTAALLSNGDVYYIPFWHRALPHWKSINALLSPALMFAYRSDPLSFDVLLRDFLIEEEQILWELPLRRIYRSSLSEKDKWRKKCQLIDSKKITHCY